MFRFDEESISTIKSNVEYFIFSKLEKSIFRFEKESMSTIKSKVVKFIFTIEEVSIYSELSKIEEST